MSAPLSLTVIIVNWNTRELLRQCLESLLRGAGPEFRIMVLDNASKDGSAEMVAHNFPEVQLIRNRNNLGFAAANNIGLRSAETDYVCLLNSDTEASPLCLRDMVDFLSRHPGVVACGPALRLPSGRLQTGGAGFEISLITAFNYFFFLSKLFPFRFRGIFVEQGAYVVRRKAARVDWLAGACLMVRSSVIEQVGGLDESFFMYAEDAEWCDRLREAGEIYYLPYLEILHYHGASSSKKKVSTTWLDATFKYFTVKHSAGSALLFRAIAGCGFFLRLTLYALLATRRADARRQVVSMYRYLLFTITGR